MCGMFGTDMLEDAIENASCAQFQVVSVLMFFKMMLVGRDIDAVGFSAAGHRDVERLTGHFR